MGFKRYVFKRVILLLPIFIGISIISFSLIHLLPGSPIKSALGSQYASPDQIAKMRAANGFDQPLYIQYINWLIDIFQLDLGTTIVRNRNITYIVSTTIPKTYWLAGSAALVSILIGIPAGIIGAVHQYSIRDNIASTIAFLGLSMPNFWLGILLILLFGQYLLILPTYGFVDPISAPVSSFKHLVLPAIALGTASAALVTRMMRSSMVEVLSEEYIQAARAKGLPGRTIIGRHAVRNALMPTITSIGLNFGYLLGGSIIIEQVFSIPGLGRLVLNAITNREYGIVQIVLALIGITFALINLITDVIYAYIDPRINYD